MINYLTSEQESLIPVVKDEWKDIILDTSPTNKYQSEIAINSLYKTADLEPPEIVWFENPIDACLWLGEQSAIINPIHSFPIEWSCPATIDRQPKLHQTLERKLNNNCYTYFSDVIYSVLESTAIDYLFDREWFDFQHVLRYSPLNYYDNAIVADYCDLANIRYSGIKRNWKEVVKALGFGIWWALSDLAVVVSKPSAIKLDDNLRLHSEDEPALEYKQPSTITDEHFKIYANHGNLLLIK